MFNGLENKTAIVTGGGALGEGIGNGRAACILLARSGANVLVVDRDVELAERTVTMIESEGGRAKACEADVTTELGAISIVESALGHWGGLHVLVNNVGIGSRKNVVEEARQTWDRVFEVNVTSMFECCKQAVPAIAEAGGGAIVNISSISALRPRGLTTYSMSKGAVIALTKALAVDHGPQRIRVNCVAPGPVYTPMVYGRGMSEPNRQNRRDASVLGIEGTGWDIGNAVTFLCSDAAQYITGQTLVVDGGATLRGPERSSG
jgi:NAD(P)-dependent dehydrogenase (short-subunit alcohol dehydrogenase family)